VGRARAEKQRADAGLALARSELARHRELARQQIVSAELLDAKETEFRAAEAPGDRKGELRGAAERFGKNVWVRKAGRGRQFVYVARGGRVKSVGVASRQVARRPATLRRHLAAI
jgi:hypothetical protein